MRSIAADRANLRLVQLSHRLESQGHQAKLPHRVELRSRPHLADSLRSALRSVMDVPFLSRTIMSNKTSSTLVLAAGGCATGAGAAGCWLNAGGQTRAP